MQENLYGRSRAELEEILGPLTGQRYHARQIYQWIHGRGEREFSRMTDLSGALRRKLAELYRVDLPRVELRQSSQDGTVKYLLRLEDGKAVEAVYIPESRRITFCVSSQIGCPLACTFCLTGKMGLVRNLGPGEIAGQVSILAGEHDLPPNSYNLVFMGMGEPMNNYDNVMAAFRLLTDPEGFGISPKRITLSTAGVVPGIRRLAAESPRPRLAVSLSATTAVLFGALREMPLAHRERVTLEYVLLRGINDSTEDAGRLATLAGSMPVKVNLIPYNEAGVGGYAPPELPAARAFRDFLLARGIRASVRKRRGADIAAACGQLAILDPTMLQQPAAIG